VWISLSEEVVKIDGDMIMINPKVMVAGKLYKFRFKDGEYGIYKTMRAGKIVVLYER